MIAGFVVFYGVGLGLLAYGLRSMKLSIDAGAWPTTEGVIKSCETRTDSDGDCRVQVEYSYAVDGRMYSNDKVAFGYGGSGDRAEHQRMLSRLQNAQTVVVRYDADNPRRAVLSYGVHRSIRSTIAFAVCWLVSIIGCEVLSRIGTTPVFVIVAFLFIVSFNIFVRISSTTDDVLLENLVTR